MKIKMKMNLGKCQVKQMAAMKISIYKTSFAFNQQHARFEHTMCVYFENRIFRFQFLLEYDFIYFKFMFNCAKKRVIPISIKSWRNFVFISIQQIN